MTIKTSPQFTLDWRDIAKGLIAALVASVAPIIGDTITAWINGGFIGPLVFDLAHIWQAAVAGIWAWLSIKYFSKAKTVTPAE
jgi:hypothetical protein